MRILEVNHGYPPRYNAGSEIYTQTVSRGLAAKGHDVAVFTREEDPYRPDFDLTTETDESNPSIKIYLANHARSRDRYQHKGMDETFETVLHEFDPDIVHINHLNHLSIGIIQVANDEGLPTVFTLHDFWLACPRGQFIQMALGEPQVYPECSSQNDEKCSKHCMSRIWGGVNLEEDHRNWTHWVNIRMNEVKRLTEFIDVFLSPSHHLRHRMIKEIGLDPTKIIYEPYGFDIQRLTGRNRHKEEEYVFGYIGRIVPAKGIDLLLKAFGQCIGKSRLRIWGRTTKQDSPTLRRILGTIPEEKAEKIEWLPEYRNEDIIKKVFNNVDCIVVPSIWEENSPLVIQEAMQARVPVVTSNKGGMGELVKNKVNGLNFEHRSTTSLSEVLQYAIEHPSEPDRFAERGFLGSENGNVHSIEDHVAILEDIFKRSL